MLKENIKKLRKSKGFTQEELAIRLNVVRQTVSKWEKGYSVPDAEILQKMADVFETDVKTLLGENKFAPNENNDIVEQLSRINEQLAIKNRRAKRIWKIIIISIIVCFVLIPMVYIILFVGVRTETKSETTACATEWSCELKDFSDKFQKTS